MLGLSPPALGSFLPALFSGFLVFLLLLPCQTYAAASNATIYDAIIVGGGFSGLATAQKLAAAGRSFVVLEARERVGGRVHNVPLPDGTYTEVGAEFVGPTQDKVIALARTLGLKLFPTYNTGYNVLFHDGQRSTYQSDGPLGAVPPVDPVSLLQVEGVQSQLDNMAKSIDVQKPWNSSSTARSWDQQTLEQWLDGMLLTPAARFLVDTAMESIFSVEPAELSLLYTVAYIAAAGNETTPGSVERLISTGSGGSQMYRVEGGTAQLAIKLAESLGSSVVLNAPVKTISQPSSPSSPSSGAPMAVTLANGTIIHGKHVVVAMSPPLAARIAYDPPLPAARDQLCQHMAMGSIGKAVALYPSPFWRKSNLTGQAVSDAGLGRVTFDQSVPGSAHGALMAFLEADQVRAYDNATDDTIAATVRSDFVNYFGPDAASPSAWVVFRWDAEEYSRGGPVAVAGPNVLTQWGPALRNRVGNLHFAGTESSDYWVGYMDGALRSGYRAASEILA